MPFVNGDADMALANEILRTTVGSEVHGLALPGSDRDEMGIYIEPPQAVFNPGSPPQDNVVIRTADQYQRSGPGDTDLVLYSLRRYLGLAAAGNPTVLLPLFAPTDAVVVLTPLGVELRSIRQEFLTQEAVRRFLGYMSAQWHRMMGHDNKHTPNRPELIEKYGWDVKYGSHALRLAHEGYEIATSGRLTLPLDPEVRERVLAVKRGEVPRDEVSDEILRIGKEIDDLLTCGQVSLPTQPDWARLADWSTQAHLRHWQESGVNR